MKNITNKLPRILLAALIAILAWFIGKTFSIIGSPVLGILFGMILAFWKKPTVFNDGVKYTSKKLLQYSIILLGFDMDLFNVFKVGSETLVLMAFTLTAAFVTAFVAGRFLKLDSNIKTLIGVGTAICGGSAIAAFLFPFLGHILGMSDRSFGLWAGTAVNDTSSVFAPGIPSVIRQEISL